MATSYILNCAQSFYIDPSAVKGAPLIDISSIDVFFNQKPKATGNKSGINYPGVVIYLVNMTPDKQPDIQPIISGNYAHSFARVEYVNIATSADASRPTKFHFAPPIPAETRKSKAFVIKFDGNEDFILWANKKGDDLVGTHIKSTGAVGKYYGDYYDTYHYDTTTQVLPVWNIKADVDLKFVVYAARFAANGVPYNSNNTMSDVYGENGTPYSNLSII